MEVLSPKESLDEGDWISPRISFSQDFPYPGRFSPKSHLKDSPADEDFSFDFYSSINLDLPTDNSMLSAEELFFNGKLRLLQNGVTHHACNAHLDEGNGGRSIEDNPRSFSMTIESCRGDVRYRRAYMSLHNSRCSSPSRTMSMPRITPTSPKASPSKPSSSSSSKYSSKLKDFFKLKKINMSKDAFVPSSSVLAEVSREHPRSSAPAGCRQPSRSFWPFSRSNSAGESTNTPVVSPPPRRSNSAGEGKTTSSSLLPTGIVPSEHPAQRTHKDLSCLESTNPSARGLSSCTKPTSSSSNASMEVPRSKSNMAAVKCFPSTAAAKKGLPPLPNSSLKKKGSFFTTSHCGSDVVISSSQPIASPSSMQACAPSDKNSEAALSGVSAMQTNASHLFTGSSLGRMRETTILPDARNPDGDVQPTSGVHAMLRKGRGSISSPKRPVRRGAHSSVSINFTRGSPGRRGAWNSPGRGAVGRVSIRNLDRGSVSSKGHVRPKDMLSRDGVSVRISPVLNVGIPSLRGSKASSRSKIFSLGSLFLKKEKVAGEMHAVLPTQDSQGGG